MRDTHRRLADASTLINVVTALDQGSRLQLVAAHLATPDFTSARHSAAQLADRLDRLDRLDERPRPAQRRIRLNDGRVITVPSGMAADWHGQGRVTEWLDGWAAETPPSR